MASLQQDILAIIEICHSAIAIPKKSRPNLGAGTIGAARKLLARLKNYDTSDATLATIRLNDGRVNWWEILYAMEAAETLLERELDRVRLLSAVRAGRFSEHMPLEDQMAVFTEVIGADSLDLVELDMALEEQGVKLRSLADLMRYLEGSDPDSPGVVVRS